MTSTVRERRVCATLWEAATCSSLPAWVLAADCCAWPANRPVAFAATVTAGASVAFVAFHLLPALAAREWPSARLPRFVRFLTLAAVIWCAIGAGASFAWLAKSNGPMLLSYPDGRAAGWIAAVSIGVAVIALVFRTRQRHQAVLATVLTALPIGLLAVTVIAQWRGMSIHNERLITEQFLDDNAAVLRGMLLASSPVAIFAFRIGRDKPAVRTILTTGLNGVWLPLVLTVVLVSLAKMTGARLYWRPSVPIDVSHALIWLHSNAPSVTGPSLVLISIAPMAATAWWIREVFEVLRAWWARLALLAAMLAIVSIPEGWEYRLLAPYFLPWCWSILFGAGLLLPDGISNCQVLSSGGEDSGTRGA